LYEKRGAERKTVAATGEKQLNYVFNVQHKIASYFINNIQFIHN